MKIKIISKESLDNLIKISKHRTSLNDLNSEKGIHLGDGFYVSSRMYEYCSKEANVVELLPLGLFKIDIDSGINYWRNDLIETKITYNEKIKGGR